jgi:hypothetical protein
MTPITFRTHRGLYEQITLHAIDKYGDEDFDASEMEQRCYFVGVSVSNQYPWLPGFDREVLNSIIESRMRVCNEYIKKFGDVPWNCLDHLDFKLVTDAKRDMQYLPAYRKFLEHGKINFDFHGGTHWEWPLEKKTQAAACSQEPEPEFDLAKGKGKGKHKVHVTDRV